MNIVHCRHYCALILLAFNFGPDNEIPHFMVEGRTIELY